MPNFLTLSVDFSKAKSHSLIVNQNRPLWKHEIRDSSITPKVHWILSTENSWSLKLELECYRKIFKTAWGRKVNDQGSQRPRPLCSFQNIVNKKRGETHLCRWYSRHRLSTRRSRFGSGTMMFQCILRIFFFYWLVKWWKLCRIVSKYSDYVRCHSHNTRRHWLYWWDVLLVSDISKNLFFILPVEDGNRRIGIISPGTTRWKSVAKFRLNALQS